MDSKNIGDMLMRLRKIKEETAADVAKAVGVSTSAISMYENGERIPRDAIKIKLARHFNVSIESIFYSQK